MSTVAPSPPQLSRSGYAQSLLRRLAGELPRGARLPGERELAARWGVARMTLRKGIDTLVEEGKLERRHGAGTFVASRPIVRALGLTSFSEDMRERGLEPSTHTVAFHRIAATAPIARQLGVSPGTPLFSFLRLRLAEGHPIALETTWLAARLVPGLEAYDLSGSLYDLLSERYGLVAARASTLIGAANATERDAQLLMIDTEDPCLRVTMLDSTADGAPLMFAICLYRADRYQLHAELAHRSVPRAAPRRSGSLS